MQKFDRSGKFWDGFIIPDESLNKKLGIYEIQLIDNPGQIVAAVNPKEYFKTFEKLTSNKKHKGFRKNIPGIDFENYADKILF